ncbi:MAG: putative Ig domain-containing protein, partial [Alphaproteobacteria bacterium]|nr:putative Ig domain-containing protein [Alphaproteobacteria bacterium]
GTVAARATSLSILVTATDTVGLSASETFNVIVPTPIAPTVTAQTADQTWKQGQAVKLALPSYTFTDPQFQPLTYSATLASGAALPSWLKFNATSETFTGTAPSGAATLSIQVTAKDFSGLTASETFSAQIVAPPTVTSLTPTQTWTQGQAVNFTLASNTFTDPQGQTLTYTATLANGTALPTWLSFNSTTETFTGTVPGNTSGLTLQVTAKDTSGYSASETFAVKTPAQAPVVTTPTPTQSWTAGQPISFTLPASTFTDPQGENLTYSGYQLVNKGDKTASWLNFNNKTLTLSGTVPGTAMGSLALEVDAKNTNGLTVADTFNISYQNVTGIKASSASLLVASTTTQPQKVLLATHS